MLIKEQLLTSGQYNVQKTSNKLFVWGLGTSGQVNSVLYLFSLAQLSAGNSHTVALTSDNRLLAWGNNASGQLGDGTTINKSFPQQVGAKGGWKRVSAGGSFTVAIRGDGTLYTWGLNSSGQLGIGLTTNRSSPTLAGAGVIWNNIEAGSEHVLATDNSALLYTWGLNNAGQLGDVTTVNRSTPVQIFSVTDVSANSNLITKFGTSYSTGIVPIAGSISGLFNGSSGAGAEFLLTTANSTTNLNGVDWTIEFFTYLTAYPTGTATNYANFVQATTGGSNWRPNVGVGINDTGTLYYYVNQLLYDNVVTLNLNVWTHIALVRLSGTTKLYVNGIAGALTSSADVPSINLAFWIGKTDNTPGFGTNIRSIQGYVSNLRIVNGVGVYTGNFTVPTSVLTATQSAGTNISAITGSQTSLLIYTTSNASIGQISFSQVSAGLSFSAAIDTDYKLYTWGLNASGQLGHITIVDPINRSSPVQVGTSSWQLVSAGQGHTAAIRLDGTLWTWGLNTSFQLGNNSSINRSSPIQVTTGSGSGSWKNVSAGNAFTLAIANDPLGSTDNLLFSWGRNQEGQTGFASSTTLRSTPQQITTGSWSLISAGSSFSVATNDNKLLYNWGSGAGGTQADGITINRSSPVLVSFSQTISQSSPIQIGVDSWSIISGGNNFFVGLRSDYRLFTWGLNSSGQLGDNTTITKSSPVAVGTSSWTAVAAGIGTALAVRTDTTLWGWGDVQALYGGVPPQRSYIDILGNSNTKYALRSDNTIWGWGQNNFGQLGQNDTVNRSNPVQIGASISWKKLAYTADWFSCFYAIATDDTAYAVGFGGNGEFANNTTINRSNPIQIMADKTWNTISGGLGITTDGALWTWGYNGNGTLGLNDTINRSSPTQILSGTSFTFVSGGYNGAYAITTTGTLYSMGRGGQGQIGDGFAIGRSTPTTLASPFDTYSWVQVVGGQPDTVTGAHHTLAIRSDGTLWVWGSNNVGQLGLNTTINRSSPVQLGTASWQQVAGGNSRSVALDSNGFIFSWGLNSASQVGDGTAINRSSPVLVNSFTHVKIASDWFGSASIREDGTLYVWGTNNLGNLGDGTTVGKTVPTVQIPVGQISSPVQIGATSNYTQLAAGTSFYAAIDSVGSLYTWGLNTSGQLGQNTTTTNSRLIPVKLDNNSWSQVSAGADHMLAIRNNGQLYAWGGNAGYQLGNDTIVNYSSPIQVGQSYAGLPITSWIEVSAGTSYSLGIDSNYKLYGWGLNNAGQLGIVTESFSWTQLDGGSNYAGAIRQDGTLWMWGINTTGNLGTGNTLSRSSPTQIGTSSWTQVAATKSIQGVTAAIRSDGLLFTWGTNQYFALGDNSTVNKSSPVQIGNSSWSQVSVGWYHTLAIDAAGRLFGWGFFSALNSSTAPFSWTMVSENTSSVVAVRSDGLLFTWGLNSSGQLGDGTTITKSSPTQIGTSSWTVASAGTNHVLAITSDYRLFAWGGNAANQLGDNSTVSKSSPVQVVNPVVSWTSVTAANSFSMGITSTNSLYVWGLGTSGQLGTLTEILSWNTISAGSSNSLAIRSDSRLYGWGLNTSFQLGDGSSITKSSPVQVAGTLSYSQVSAGVNHTLAITNNGELYGWGVATTGATGNYGEVYSWNMVAGTGDNSFFIRSDGSLWATGPNTLGVLGLNDTFARSSPVQVGTSSWIFVNAGGSASGPVFGITSDYKLFSWGANDSGQCADGTTIRKSSPVQVGVGSSWIQAATGGSGYSLMLKSDYTLWTAGIGVNGRLGLNDVISRSNPTQIGTSSWTQIAVGSASLAIRADNTLWSWGVGNFGQLGIGVTTDRSSPVQVTTPGTGPWLAIAANEDYSLAISGAGLGTPYSVYFIGGANIYGQAGLNTAVGSISLPTLTKAGTAGSSFVQVTTNGLPNADFVNHALTSDGKMWGWGYNTQGFLGDGTNVNKSSPVLVTGTTSWSQLPKRNAGRLNYGIATNNTLWGWALTPFYTTYNAAPIQVSNPIQIGGNIRWANYNSPIYAINSEAGQGSWTSVSAGNNFSLGIKNNLLYGWGQNVYGETGTNLTTNPIFSPIQIGTSSWSVVSASELGNFAGGIRSDNKLFMWGTGLAQIAIQYSVSDYSWIQLSSGWSHTVGIKSDGSLWTWGNNAFGQLGQGDTITRSSPTQIPGTDSWLLVSAGIYQTYAIKSDGTLWSTGYNYFGTLGVSGAVIDRSNLTQIGTSSWAQVAANGYYSVYGIDALGQLYNWGWNDFGQLALTPLSASATRSTPVLVSSVLSWTSVSAAGRFVAATKSDFSLWIWGLVQSGVSGDGTTINKSSPTQVPGSWRQVVAHGYYTAGLNAIAAIRTDNTLWGWGVGTLIGNNSAISRSSPVQIGSNYWTQISSAGIGILAVDVSNSLYVWGDNTSGALGLNDTINRSSPTLLAAPLGTSWRFLSITSNNGPVPNINKAMDSTGNLWIWGDNSYYGLGIGDTINRSSPVQLAGNWAQVYPIYSYSFLVPALPSYTSSPVQIGNSSWTQLSAGASHSLAIRADGTLWSWGTNTNRQLGFGDTTIRSSPTQIGTDSWTSVSAGFDHSMAIRTDGTLWAWGSNTLGQMGLATSVYSWIQVANTGLTTHAIRSDGLLFAWGLNTSGEIGDNSIVNKSSPVQIGTKTWKKVYNFTTAIGNFATVVAIDDVDNLFAWGSNVSGNLGDNTTINKSSPVAVTTSGTGSWTQAFVGAATVAIQNNGTLWGWGNGAFIGDNTTISKSNPVQIGSSSWSMVGGALSSIAAIDSVGRLFTWGNQSVSGSGSLGTNDLINRSSPTLLAGAAGTFSWIFVSSGGANHIMAITNGGEMYGMGLNTQGQLGNNTVVNRSTATQVTGSTIWSKVSCGFSFTLASASDGSIWGWGNNDWGQATYNVTPTAANRSSPVLVISGSPAVLSTGQYNTALIYPDGLLFNWGYNLYGMLGDSSVVAKSSPVQIGNNADINTSLPVQIGTGSWSQVSAGNQYTLARDTNGILYAWGQDTTGQLGF